MSTDLRRAEGDDSAEVHDSVAHRVRERMGDCSPAERKVARALLAAYPVAGFETVAGLADLAEVSGATVVRFTTRLGYRGFPDFQRALRDELEDRSASPAALFERTALSRRSAEGGDLATLAEGWSDDLRATFGGLSAHDFSTTVGALADTKRRVWIAGGRYSGFLAEYLSASLQQLRTAVQMVPQMGSLRSAAMSGFTAKDVLIVMDFRRYEAETRRLVQHAKRRKAMVVVITDRWVSPCAGDADTVLTSVASERGPFDSVVPVMALVEALFEATLAAMGDPARERMERIEQTAQELELM